MLVGAAAALLAAVHAQWLSLLLLVAAGLYAAYIVVDREKLAPRTGGTVFIETPQIYTRERLVNDRFVQESWLRDVLRQEVSFAPSETVSITDQSKRGMAINLDRTGEKPAAGDGSSDARAGSAAAVPQAPSIPPPLNFLMQNAYRELIRSHLIENQLDDRHDIRGTTIYLLKFDVSVIPGNNTRKRAFVHARMTREASALKPVPRQSSQESLSPTRDSAGVVGKATERP